MSNNNHIVANLPGSEHSILVVEDDTAVARVLALVFADEEEYRVSVASNGSRALEMAAAEAPELVTLDLTLPDMNGQEFLTEFRARGFTAPVLVISAASGGEQKAHEMGADSFIAKPFDIDNILATVGRLLHLGPPAVWPAAARA